MLRSLAILAAIGCGILLPALSEEADWIRWILFAMLFLGFSGMPLERLRPVRAHLKLLMAWPLFIALGWLIMWPFGREAQLAGLLVAATPTATAAPVITGILGGDVGFVSVAFLGSNLVGAFLLPVLLSVAGAGRIPSMLPFLAQTLALVFLPLGLSAAVRRIPGSQSPLRRLRRLSFPLWLAALVLASAKTSEFLRGHPETGATTVLAIAGGSALLCALHFLVGRLLGGKAFALEAGQSLGQKNTMLTLWLGLSAFGPVPALGPAFYVLWHNLWNASQMARGDLRKR
jgi:bile acid:Na+ symporter, BASS family